jgi:hypothetical protein
MPRHCLPRAIGVVLLGGTLACVASGCRSTSGSFRMDSNSRAPWFGLNLSLPKASAERKTLETISDTAPESDVATTADLKISEPPSRKRSLLPRWLGGKEEAIPLPEDAVDLEDARVIRLEAPRAEFQ